MHLWVSNLLTFKLVVHSFISHQIVMVMKAHHNNKLSRRDFMKLSALAAAGMTVMPNFSCTTENFIAPMKRRFGKTNFNVTTLGLGGQSSLQWTPEGVDPVPIIRKAFEMGVNYFDTSNLYGPSQQNYGKAFKTLDLIPGQAGYNKSLRESIFITTKTLIRWAKGGGESTVTWRNTDGDHGEGAVADLKRSLSQLFGDNNGNYPDGSYVDMIMMHSITSKQDLDILYKGLETPLNQDENYGALIALRDYRDGTNHTGLNPKHEKLVKHLGFSGHYSSPVMMEMIRRDKWDLLDGMSVSINVNDRRYLNMQYNVIEVAKAKDMGVVGMKVFADGAMYTKEANWSGRPEHVVMTVGSEKLPSNTLIEYALTTPGIDTLIIGIGHIDEDPLKCQLVQNYYAAQIKPDALTEAERRNIEGLGLLAKDGKTNYFQLENTGLTPPANIKIRNEEKVKIEWDTAVAGDEPISHYEILVDGNKVDEIKHYPQISTVPFSFEIGESGNEYAIAAVDKLGRKAISEILRT
jgi:aryl-alcohol dehydrogenase-like predicted oxidoreductase